MSETITITKSNIKSSIRTLLRLVMKYMVCLMKEYQSSKPRTARCKQTMKDIKAKIKPYYYAMFEFAEHPETSEKHKRELHAALMYVSDQLDYVSDSLNQGWQNSKITEDMFSSSDNESDDE